MISNSKAAPSGLTHFHYLLVVCLLLPVYLITMPKVISLEDAGLFQMVCAFGGIAHPPGYPLFTLLCHPISTWLSDLRIVAGNSISSLFACGTVCLLMRTGVLLTRNVLASLTGSVVLGFSAAFWSQAIIIEVYTLNTFLFGLLLLQTIEIRRSATVRRFALLGFVYGLALANHWPLIVLSSPGLAWIILSDNNVRLRLTQPRILLLLGGFGLLGISPYLSLLVKDSFIAFDGNLSSVSDLFRIVSRTTYADATDSANWHDQLRLATWFTTNIPAEVGWLALITSFYGSLICRRSHPQFFYGSWLIFLFNSYLLIAIRPVSFTYSYQSTFQPYPLIAYMILCIWLMIGFDQISKKLALRRYLRVMAAIGFCVVVLLQNVGLNNRTDHRLAHYYGSTVLATLESQANLFIYGDYQTGPIGYLHYVEKMRADIQLYSKDNLFFGNRLTSPYAARSNQLREMESLIENSPQESYITAETELPVTDYGLYFRYRRAGQPAFVFLPEHQQFLDYLLRIFESGGFVHPHERIFSESLLLNFSRQYSEYAFSEDRPPLSKEMSLMLERLRQTFSGKLMLIAYMLNHPQLADKGILLALAIEAEAQLPTVTIRHNQSLFFQYFGYIHLLDGDDMPPNELEAISKFRKSLDIASDYPGNSLCPLTRLYVKRKLAHRLDNLRQRYDVDSAGC